MRVSTKHLDISLLSHVKLQFPVGVNVVFMFALPGLSVLFPFLLAGGLLPTGARQLCLSLGSFIVPTP